MLTSLEKISSYSTDSFYILKKREFSWAKIAFITCVCLIECINNIYTY